MQDPDCDFQIFLAAAGRKEIVPQYVTRGPYVVSQKHLQYYALQGDLEVQLLPYWKHGKRFRRFRFSLDGVKPAARMTAHPRSAKAHIKESWH